MTANESALDIYAAVKVYIRISKCRKVPYHANQCRSEL